MEELTNYWTFFQEKILEIAPDVGLALLILLVGFQVTGRLVKLADMAMARGGLTEDIRPFLSSLLSVSIKVLIIFSAAGAVGIETTSFVAVLAAAGFAIGMALQGSLSNFAAGVIILVFRPYKKGDLVEIEGQMGHVAEIQIFNTIITTLDNRTIIIPNATASGGIITNLSSNDFLRIDLNVTMPYAEDFEKVKTILLEAVKATPNVLTSPEPFVGIETFDSHNIVLAVRPYAKTEDYWDVYFEANQNIKKAMGENQIKIAYSEGVELGSIGL